jgi:hypothetical protein
VGVAQLWPPVAQLWSNARAVAVDQRQDGRPRPDERTGLVRRLRHRITELNRKLRDEYDRGFADGQADLKRTDKARKLATVLGLAAGVGTAFRKLHPTEEPSSEAIAHFAETELGLFLPESSSIDGGPQEDEQRPPAASSEDDTEPSPEPMSFPDPYEDEDGGEAA